MHVKEPQKGLKLGLLFPHSYVQTSICSIDNVALVLAWGKDYQVQVGEGNLWRI